MNEAKDKMKGMSFAELLDTLEAPEPYRFPYEDYKIIGDTGEIDKIIYAHGIINLDLTDVASTLSTEAANYLSVGTAYGDGAIAEDLQMLSASSLSNRTVSLKCFSRSGCHAVPTAAFPSLPIC